MLEYTCYSLVFHIDVVCNFDDLVLIGEPGGHDVQPPVLNFGWAIMPFSGSMGLFA